MFEIDLLPINRASARVASKGVHYDHRCQDRNTPHWHIMPEVCDINPISGIRAGQRKGRLVVTGKYPQNVSKKRTARYVVRCDCGRFTIRCAKSIRNSKNKNDMCGECRQVENLKLRI